jgi:hypothetical protein
MKYEERLKMFKDIFAPKPGEKILFLIDTPHDDIRDCKAWEDRREMAREWHDAFKRMGAEEGLSVDWMEYKATGLHNSPLPQEVIDAALKSNLVIAMTQWSPSSSLRLIRIAKGTITRCASMPLVERRMEETSLGADYAEVKSTPLPLRGY